MDKNQLKIETEQVNNFGVNFKITKDLLNNYLRKLKNKDQKISLLGAGHLACSFINYFDISKYFVCIIDLDRPNKIST